MILPHGGDTVAAGVNDAAFEYNIPLRAADIEWKLGDFSPLWLQAVKLSEDGRMLVVRLSEQNGARGELRLPRRARLPNMLEDVTGEADMIEYSPYEIITLGFETEA